MRERHREGRSLQAGISPDKNNWWEVSNDES